MATTSDLVASLTNLTTTENNSLAHRSTLDACLDVFYKVVPDMKMETLWELLERAWKEDSLLTMKLIFQLRDVRNGKNDKKSFHHAAQWLIEEHPETLLANLELVPEFGYWKDVLEMVKWNLIRDPGSKAPDIAKSQGYFVKPTAFKPYANSEERQLAKKKRREERRVAPLTDEERQKVIEAAREEQRRSVQETHQAWKQLSSQKAAENAVYGRLLAKIAELFASALHRDLEKMAATEFVSTAAKWCPSAEGMHDLRLGLNKRIALAMYPASENKREEESDQQYAIRAKNRLRKEVLSPLRRYANVTEVRMSANQWGEIPYAETIMYVSLLTHISCSYNLVHALCMKQNNKHFSKHDQERFGQYLADVKQGKTTITASALLPHTIVTEMMSMQPDEKSDTLQTLELQWDRIVADLKKSGGLDSSLAVCDVSGSMAGIPMVVAIALSLLTCTLAEGPFRDVMCTFSERPSMFRVPDVSLLEKVRAVTEMPWGMNTDFQAVFDLILSTATRIQLAPNAMIKRVLVFSDMQFDQASSGKYKGTDHDVIRQKFQDAGYNMPQIVYWNLRDSVKHSCPVTKHESGALLMSGFSGQMLKAFMNGEQLDMQKLVVDAVKGPLYDRVHVVD